MAPDDAPPTQGPRRPRAGRRTIAVAIAAAVLLLVAGGWVLRPILAAPGSSSVSPSSAPGPGASGAIEISGRSHVTISGRAFRGIADRPAIVVRHSDHVVIEDNDFVDDSEPIYVESSTDVTITGNRYRNITGPHERNGSHRGNFTQWVDTIGGSISDNTGVGGDTEDIISIYRSGGRSAASPLRIERNVFTGTDWTSSSGSGILVGDNGSKHVLVRDNTLTDPGQVGIGIAGGTDITVTGNTVTGSARPSSNVGIYVWNQTAETCSDITVTGNRVRFRRADGTSSPLYDGGGCGVVSGWAGNDIG